MLQSKLSRALKSQELNYDVISRAQAMVSFVLLYRHTWKLTSLAYTMTKSSWSEILDFEMWREEKCMHKQHCLAELKSYVTHLDVFKVQALEVS